MAMCSFGEPGPGNLLPSLQVQVVVVAVVWMALKNVPSSFGIYICYVQPAPHPRTLLTTLRLLSSSCNGTYFPCDCEVQMRKNGIRFHRFHSSAAIGKFFHLYTFETGCRSSRCQRKNYYPQCLTGALLVLDWEL